MFLKKISLENFRNHTKAEYNLNEGITIFLGENGKGKTNILEAIFALSTTKAFRTNKKEVFVMHEKEYGRVKGEIIFSPSSSRNFSGAIAQEKCAGSREKETEYLEIFWSLKPRKNIYKKSDIQKSASDFIQEKKFLSVLFSPEDMNLPVLSPSHRRKFLSRILSPLFSEYFTASLKYETILKNRNELLKKFTDGYSKKDEFIFWNTELVKYHEILQKFRNIFFDEINTNISEIYTKISGKQEEVKIKFLPYSCIEKDFSKILEENFERDVFMRRTMHGSHRDDFQIFLRNIPIEEDASRGETRSVLLALKIAEKNFVEKISGKKPVLLLDDVFSELDKNHQKHLLESISSHQTIITSTHSEVALENFGAKIYDL